MALTNEQQPSQGSAPAALVGYDGSIAALAMIQVGAELLPHIDVTVVNLWDPPLRPSALRRRVAAEAGSLAELVDLLEKEGGQEAQRLADAGVVLARAAGWERASAAIRRSNGGDGLLLAGMAEELGAALVVVGSRGLSGVSAVLGSFSDTLVHHSGTPVLVVPYPLLQTERNAAAKGPVLVGWDGSEGARSALLSARQLFPERDMVVAAVGDADDPAEALAVVGAQEGSFTAVRLRPLAQGSPGPGRTTAEALVACARSHQAAVIVVGSRGRIAVKELLLGSVAMATLHHAHRPVLVVPPHHAHVEGDHVS